MRKKDKNFLLDKFPYILLGIILIFSLIVFLPIRSCMPLNFFSGAQEETENELEYSIFISSPTNNKIFSFINQNETVPVEIKAKEVENTDYTIKLLINDYEIKSFTSPPYEYNWNPGSSGEYEIIAQLVDENYNIIANSNIVNFTVQYDIEPEEETIISVNVEEKINKILSQPIFRIKTLNTIPPETPLISYKCYIPPIINGSFQEWDMFKSFSEFVPTIMEENYTTHTDISGIFYSCWDDDNFYFVVQVIDDVSSQNYTGDQLNKGDSITIAFDTELEEDMYIYSYSSDDYRIDFSPGNFSRISSESEYFISYPYNAPPGGIKVASTRLTNGYLLEASISWYNFPNYTHSDEDVLGFTISIFDTDWGESTELVISSSQKFDPIDVSTLGAIVLIDAGNIQIDEEEPEDEPASEDTTGSTD